VEAARDLERAAVLGFAERFVPAVGRFCRSDARLPLAPAASELAGSYQAIGFRHWQARFPDRFFLAAFAAMTPDENSRIAMDDQGQIFRDGEGPYRERLPGVWVGPGGKTFVATRQAGRIVLPSTSVQQMQKLQWHQQPWVSFWPWLISWAWALTLPLAWAVARLRKRRAPLGLAALGTTLFAVGTALEVELVNDLYIRGGQLLPMLLWRAVLYTGWVAILAGAVRLAVDLIRRRSGLFGRALGWINVAMLLILALLAPYWGLVLDL
jgi:hypothetical protein